MRHSSLPALLISLATLAVVAPLARVQMDPAMDWRKAAWYPQAAAYPVALAQGGDPAASPASPA